MEIKTTDTYDKWFRRVRDTRARARINLALRRCQLEGQLVGDLKPVGQDVFEMRFHFGPGYRIYFIQQAQTLVLLLLGGDKSTQVSDIEKAKSLAQRVRKEQQWQ